MTPDPKELKERPIIFSGEMVRAILDGRKTQTRRIVKDSWFRCLDPENDEDRASAIPQCPHGAPGDRLLVSGEASRITLEIVGVRVDLLQDISEEDAKAEGMQFHNGGEVGHSGYRHDVNYGYVFGTAKDAFAVFWNSIHGDGAWENNPWVWVIEFKRIEPEEP